MIELAAVSKRFGNFVAVDNVTLHVGAAEFLTLLGPSGCGKTTLLRMISGFERPSQGRVSLDGRDVTDLPPYRRDVNQVFQSYALFPHLSVWENIAFGLRSRRTPRDELKQRVAQGVEMVGLSGMEHRRPDQLSGGQRQRVALARALVCQPKVLLLDEPLAALDAKLRRAMQAELKRLQQRVGITFLFVTHDQDEAIVMSDRIAVINRGRVEQIGSAAEIYQSPATRFVADFLGQANLIPVNVSQRLPDRVVLKINPMLSLTALPGGPTADALLACIRPEKIQLWPERPAGPNCFDARVVDSLFRGATTQVTVEAPGNLMLAALIVNQGASDPRAQRNRRVFGQIDPADVVLLAETP